jgi:hypothetical protein
LYGLLRLYRQIETSSYSILTYSSLVLVQLPGERELSLQNPQGEEEKVVICLLLQLAGMNELE